MYGHGGHVSHVTITISISNHKELSHEIWFQFAENCLRKLQYKRPWLKGQRSTLTFETNS